MEKIGEAFSFSGSRATLGVLNRFFGVLPGCSGLSQGF